jgi:hypothetical protein
MKNKFLVLGFKNAKQFKPGKYKDKVGDLSGTKDRDSMNFFVEPITKFQVSNLLHVLFGERPSPSLRETLIPRIDYYFDKAENSYIKLDSLKVKNKKGEDGFIYETMQIKKSVWNSWNPQSFIYWGKVKLLLEENYDNFINLLTELYGYNPTTKTFQWWIDFFRKNPNDKVKDYIKSLKGKTPLYTILFETGKDFVWNMNSRTMRTVNFGVIKNGVTKHHGTIIVPVSDEDLSKLSRANGTILDGGFVWIKGVFTENQIDWDDYVLLGEINSEKTNLTKYYENKNKSKQEQN